MGFADIFNCKGKNSSTTWLIILFIIFILFCGKGNILGSGGCPCGVNPNSLCCPDQNRYGFFNKYGTPNNSNIWFVVLIVFLIILLGQNNNHDDDDDDDDDD